MLPVRDALRTSLRAPPPAPASCVARSLAGSLAPAAAEDAPPLWLRPEQHYAFARALAALRRFHGAILALPVGTGKTYIALAAASAWQRTPVACIVPAALVTQWRAVAARLGVPVVVSSHELASRQRLPSGTRGLVLIDESHHFRHSGIVRYGAVADFLVGRPALMLTATPVVNRAEDLAAQLALAVRDDALAPLGLASLASVDAARTEILGALVVASAGRDPTMPARRERRIAGDEVLAPMGAPLDAVEGLALSASASVAALIRGTLLRALASSPAAFAAALRRYRLLLRQHADARAAGREPSRASIRDWAGKAADQTVLWSVLPETEGAEPGDLIPADLPLLDALIALTDRRSTAPDPKLARLADELAGSAPTLVFTVARETVTYLRTRLRQPVAWCTGNRAGIGHIALARGTVLGAFAPGSSGGPAVLVTTDVAAEGLDLQAAARVVHYDLPWTAMRLEQREGRAARLGSAHREIEVIRFDPPAAIEIRLRQLEAIARTAVAPRQVGLGATTAGWRWRDRIALGHRGEATVGTAAIASAHTGALGGFTIEGHTSDGQRERIAGELFWLDVVGTPCQDAEWLTARLAEAVTGRCRSVPEAEVDRALDQLSVPIGARLREAYRSRWTLGTGDLAHRELIRRLGTLAAAAARNRDPGTLASAERLLQIVSGGLTAGERRLVARLDADPTAPLPAALAVLRHAATPWRTVEASLTGLILFGAPPGR